MFLLFRILVADSRFGLYVTAADTDPVSVQPLVGTALMLKLNLGFVKIDSQVPQVFARFGIAKQMDR